MTDQSEIKIVRVSTAGQAKADGTATFTFDSDAGDSIKLTLSPEAVRQILGGALKVRQEGASSLIGEGAVVAVKNVAGVNVEWYQGGGIGLCLLLSQSPDGIPLRYKLGRANAEVLASNLRQMLADHKP